MSKQRATIVSPEKKTGGNLMPVHDNPNPTEEREAVSDGGGLPLEVARQRLQENVEE